MFESCLFFQRRQAVRSLGYSEYLTAGLAWVERKVGKVSLNRSHGLQISLLGLSHEHSCLKAIYSASIHKPFDQSTVMSVLV